MNKKWSLWLHDLKNIYLLYEAHFFFLLLGTYFILFYIKYTKLFIKSMFLMLLFWSTDKLRKLGQQTITAERAIWICSCSLIPAENCLKICRLFWTISFLHKKYPRLPLKLRSIKKVNPLDYPWQNQIMKTVHSETGKSIRAYAELFIQSPALF